MGYNKELLKNMEKYVLQNDHSVKKTKTYVKLSSGIVNLRL